MDKNKIVLISILSILFILVIVTNNKNLFSKKETVITDALKFKEEYEKINDTKNDNGKEYINISIDEDNPIVYSSYNEVKDIIKNKTGIIYFGFPECPWCRNAVPVLLDAAKELGVDKIYYFNALSIRDKKHLDDQGNIVVDEEGTDEYKELVQLLYDKLPVYDGLNDSTIKRLYFPTVVFVKDGNVVGLHTSTVDSQTDPYITLNKEEYQELKGIYEEYMNLSLDILCDQSC